MMATKTPTMASRFFLGFLVWVQLRSNWKSVGATSLTSVSSFSYVNFFKMLVLLSRRTDRVSIIRTEASNDAPKPLTQNDASISLQNSLIFTNYIIYL